MYKTLMVLYKRDWSLGALVWQSQYMIKALDTWVQFLVLKWTSHVALGKPFPTSNLEQF